MLGRSAVRCAIELQLLPSQIRRIRDEPLPEGTYELLKVLAEEPGAMDAAVAETGRSDSQIRAAANFFVEQILFDQYADSYRILGVPPDADLSTIRKHMALLSRWLHPDVSQESDREALALRLNAAWNDLKTVDRRCSYDQARNQRFPRPSRRSGRVNLASRNKPAQFLVPHSHHPSFLSRLLRVCFGRKPF